MLELRRIATQKLLKLEKTMNGMYAMLGKLFSVFTINVPPEMQRGAKLLPRYTLRFQFNPANGNYKDSIFVQLLDDSGEATKYRYIGMLNPMNHGKELFFTQKSPLDANTNEGKLFVRVIAKMFNGEMMEVCKSGVTVTLGIPPEPPETVLVENEPEPDAMDAVRAILH